MKTKVSRQLAAIALSFALLGSLATTVAAHQSSTRYEEIQFTYQKISWHKADGSLGTAEFIAQVALLPDGRANGALGLWESGNPNGLALYRIFAGRRLNRLAPFFEFKAQRLSPQSEDEIIINLHPAADTAPTGSVTFIIDGLNAIDGQALTLEARGHVRSGNQIASVTDLIIDGYSYINAPPQTVVVETRGGDQTAIFEHIALVFPDGEAFGFASLSGAGSGAPLFIRFTGGKFFFDEDEFNWGLMHGGATRPGQARPLPVLLVIADMQDFSEPCRIYDIAGWQGRMQFEAYPDIARFRIAP